MSSALLTPTVSASSGSGHTLYLRRNISFFLPKSFITFSILLRNRIYSIHIPKVHIAYLDLVPATLVSAHTIENQRKSNLI